MNPADRRAEEDTPNPKRWRMLWVSMAILFMSLLDVTIVNIAVPSMATSLGADPGTIQWVVSGYALTFGMTLVTGGRLGDAVGRRRMMMIGMIGFVLGGAASGLAPTVEVLILARLVQGAMAGLLVPQNSGIIQTYFRGPERGKAFGYMGMAVGVSSAFGPVVGGLILAASGSVDGWRWIFLVNVPIGLVLLVAVWKVIPGRLAPGRADIDLVGAVLIGLIVAGIIFPISRLGEGLTWSLAILMLVPILALALRWWEQFLLRRDRSPVLNISQLSAVPGYAGGALIGALYFTAFTGVMLVVAVYLQSGVGFGPLAAALHLTPLAVVTAIAAPVSGRMVHTHGRRVTIWALVLMMAGLAVAAVVIPLVPDGTIHSVTIVVLLAFIGIGAGSVVSPNLVLALENVPVPMAGAAGGALQTGQRMGTALGAAVMMMIYGITDARTGDPDLALSAVLASSLAISVLALLAALLDGRRGGR